MAETIHVDHSGGGDYTSIQEAIDAAISDSDVILVAQGIYDENIVINGKTVNLSGGYESAGWTRDIKAHKTVIDGGGRSTVVRIQNSSTMIEGFTIQNGQAENEGGGGLDSSEGSFLEIKDCIIENNNAIGENEWGGGGILMGDGKILNCIVRNNHSPGGASGIRAGDGDILIQNTLIADNTGQAAFHCNDSTGKIINCTITGNTGGGFGLFQSQVSVLNCIEWNNSRNNWGNLESITYSLIEGGNAATGNISQNPLFADPETGNYYLQTGSPCIDAGNPSAEYNDTDGTRNDMGAYGGSGGESYAYEDGPPSVENVLITPAFAFPGSTVVITADVQDAVSNVSSVKADIERPDEAVIASINLYDDGSHNDGTAGDGIYGNSWTTPSGEYDYYIDITASDNRSHIATYNNIGKFSTQIIYDDFETAPIDTSKWHESEQVREIANGKLRLNIQGDGQKSSMNVYLVNDDTRYYEAKVLVENGSYVSAGAMGVVGLSGYFYNDTRGPGSGQDYNEQEGDVWLDIRIVVDENGILKAKASASRSDNADNSLETEFFEEYFSSPVSVDTEYVLSVEVTSSEIIFKCNDESLKHTLTTPVYDAYTKDKRILSRVYADSGELGYVKATIDDVRISKGGEPYDDFETAMIDPAKWQALEKVTEVSDGKLCLSIRGSDEEASTTVHQAGDYTSYLEAKVLIESGSQVSAGATAISRIGGYFYNDTRGPGSGLDYNRYEGDVWVNNYIMLDENNNLKATAAAFRFDTADGSGTTDLFEQDFSTPILFDKEDILSIELSDTELIFKCNDETIIYSLTTPIYEAYGRDSRVLTSRLYADQGESGYIKAWFDDVRVTKEPIIYMFTKSILPEFGGIILASPDKASYDAGESVMLTATSAECYEFTGWSGDCLGSNPVCTLTMNSDKSVAANFAIVAYTLDITALNGTVTRTPEKTSYECGESVTLTAAPNSGYRFIRWEGNASGTETSVTIAINGNSSITAIFEQISTYTLDKSVLPVSGGTISASPDKASYEPGESVTLTVVPDECYEFGGWSGDCSGGGLVCTLTMDADKSVTAKFDIKTYSLNITAVNGTVTRTPDKTSYECGSTVTLSAIPNSNYKFDHWEGYLTGNQKSTIITISQDIRITAVFVPIYIISGHIRYPNNLGEIGGVSLIFSNGGGSATTNDSGFYRHSVKHGWAGIVTPNKGGYSFSPSYQIDLSSIEINMLFILSLHKLIS
ncbi:InlB B-repeat-containing protein [Desulfonema magnum]|nr:right-handed parallel beta-helix repeat-containing protein [Desulfonema magnum]